MTRVCSAAMTPPPDLSRAHPGRRLRSDLARQVADVLRGQIAAGALGPRLPDEPALQREFSVSRNSVREALDILRSEGLVERLPGVGTVVRMPKFAHTVDAIRGLSESLREHGALRNEVRTAGRVRPPRSVAAALRAEGDVLCIERLRRLDGVPIALDLTYLPVDVGLPLLSADLEDEDLFTLIERTSGKRLRADQVSVDAVTADAQSARLLGVRAGAPLLVLQRLTRFTDGTPADLEFVRMRGDRITVRMTPEA